MSTVQLAKSVLHTPTPYLITAIHPLLILSSDYTRNVDDPRYKSCPPLGEMDTRGLFGDTPGTFTVIRSRLPLHKRSDLLPFSFPLF